VVVRGGGRGQGGIGLWRVCVCVCGLFSCLLYRVCSCAFVCSCCLFFVLVLWLGLVRCVICPCYGLCVVVLLCVLFGLGV